MTRVDVVVVAYGDEPYLAACLTSVLASSGVDVRVALVDNGCRALPPQDPRVVVVRPGGNIGFAAGCNAGLAALDGEVVALVNSDAYVDPAALSLLVAGLSADVGMTTACVLLADAPDTVNAAGNPLHFLGISWAGGYGDPRSDHLVGHDVASISGAAAVLRRELWESLGGFDPAFFLYCEDLDLSLRVWQRGLRVRYVPEALAWHHYAFDRNAAKRYYLERNRLLVLLTTYHRRTLLLLAPALLLMELALLAAALKDGQLTAKLRGYGWLLRNRAHVRSRRGVVQRQRLVGDSALVPLLHGRIETPVATGAGVALTNAVLSPYWRVVRRWL